MCSFGSCETRFEFLSQFRKVRNAFECFVTQVQTHLPKTKRVWPMKINVICTVVRGLGPIVTCLEHVRAVPPSVWMGLRATVWRERYCNVGPPLADVQVVRVIA